MISLIPSRLQVDEQLNRRQVTLIEAVVTLKISARSRKVKIAFRSPRPRSPLFLDGIETEVVRVGEELCLLVLNVRSF